MPAANYTIDDAQWSTPWLSLSPGWNMLRKGGSDEYISPDQVEVMRPLLDEFWNSSVSWTTAKGASTTLSFIGTEIWAYGMSGPQQGVYTVLLGDRTMGRFTAESERVDYHYLLFAAGNLDDGVVHTLTLVNSEEGRYLAFDYLVVQSESGDTSIPTVSPSLPTSPLNTLSGGSALTTLPPTSTAPLLPGGMASTTSNGTTKPSIHVVPYTPAQLALLSRTHVFHWTPAAYFVVIFSALVSLFVTTCVLFYLVRNARNHCTAGGKRWTRKRAFQGEGSIGDGGESYLITGRPPRPRPNTRLLDALRKGMISNPVASEDGESFRRSSHGTLGTSEMSLGAAL